MIAGKILAAEFPKSGIKISNVNYIACGFGDLYAIAYSERLAYENVNPTDEAFHRRLYSEADDNRANTQCGKRSIPIDEHDGYGDNYNDKRDDQMHHTLKGETSRRVLDPAQRINGNSSRNRQKDHDQRCAA